MGSIRMQRSPMLMAQWYAKPEGNGSNLLYFPVPNG